jgi:hypothetical protein
MQSSFHTLVTTHALALVCVIALFVLGLQLPSECHVEQQACSKYCCGVYISSCSSASSADECASCVYAAYVALLYVCISCKRSCLPEQMLVDALLLQQQAALCCAIPVRVSSCLACTCFFLFSLAEEGLVCLCMRVRVGDFVAGFHALVCVERP